MYTYEYNKSISGYHFNLVTRASSVTGKPCSGISFSYMSDNTIIALCFESPLSDSEKLALDNLMSDNDPSMPPKSNFIVTIKDLWVQKNSFLSTPSFEIYYNKSSPTMTEYDIIELHFKQSLTQQQKNNLKTEYAKLMQL